MPAPTLDAARRAVSTAYALGSDQAFVSAAAAKRVQDALDEVVAMLERREATARESYDELRRRIDHAERVVRDDLDEQALDAPAMQKLRIERLSASARWTEAQEAVAAARALARTA